MPRYTPPGDAQKIAAHAQEHLTCETCGSAPGSPCAGSRQFVCRSRFITASIELKRQARAARQTPEQAAEHAALLASLPRIPKEEIEKCRTPGGGYSFTKTWFLEYGLPYPPIAGWRQAAEREEP